MGPTRLRARLLLALLTTVLAGVLTGLLGLTVVTARADDTISSRGDIEGVDAPKLPPGCFGPARTGIDPFPCPLNSYRPNRPTIIIWGDSHAYMYIPALREAVKQQNVNLISFVAGSCPPVYTTRAFGGGKCLRSNYVAFQTVKALVREGRKVKVVVGSNWSGFRIAYRRLMLEQVGIPSGYDDYTKEMVRLAHEGTPRLFDKLATLKVDVDVIGQAAVVPTHRAECAEGDDPYSCDLPRWRAIREERKTTGYLKRQLAKIQKGHTRLVDATPGYCDALVCHGLVGGIQTYFDDLHLSATRTRNLSQYFLPSVKDMHRS